EAVDRERGSRLVGIARRFRRLDVLERAEDVEQSHRDDDREVGHEMSAADCRDEIADNGDWKMESRRGRVRAYRSTPERTREQRSQSHRDHPAGNPPLEP